MLIRAIHKNFKVFEDSVGRVFKKCVCGWESHGFNELTSTHCLACGVKFEREGVDGNKQG